MIEHGHNKYDILNEYSREEVAIFYEKCVKEDILKNADFIEDVMAAIGGTFGNSKKVIKLLQDMKKSGGR